ncbi:sarcosine oxidase subunit alpha family protein [Tianweitania sediminis]|uniref:Sarcosine oxidase subunit alpha family protein n=1 Tax=Tianweitania sediminis TaxID=1502156 RepID=A0A8J7QYL8_9HYPH|nr:sarcosine oxidase subunit alpha family protein [Tianweitania sediminis]MBP0438365.1 sarcosine oxidase subunit alpha family protein [Tianweitania sediminis]
MTAYRLGQGGRIDRSRTLGFTFDGTALSGHPGDTLASALLANNRLLVGRSFKYHRPRGVVAAGAAEPNALVTVGSAGRREPNSRATMVELHDGLRAESQNRWPSLNWDVGALNGFLSPFLSAGFYYKTFMWPASFWEKLYEPFIRRAAGLGRASYHADPDRYEKVWAHCDLLVVGAGPTGLAAALTAGRAGAEVILADEASEPGGSLLFDSASVDGQPAGQFATQILAELATLPNVRLMTRTTVFGWFDDMVFGAAERVSRHVSQPLPGQPQERLWRIVAKRAILATGAEQRPLVFPGNDRPGVMLADAAVSYARRFGVGVGRKVAVFANSDAGARTAASLQAAGINVVALVDARVGHPAAVTVPRIFSGGVVSGTSGSRALGAITVRHAGGEDRFEADALAMAGGYSPRIHLACHRGGKPRWSDAHQAFLAPEGLAGLTLAGSAAGARTLGECLSQGAAEAAAVVADLGHTGTAAQFGAVDGDVPEGSVRALWHVPGGKAFVDFQNDVTVKDLGLAVREGFSDVELAKRYTTTGMATDQGKLSNVNAIGILAEARGVSPAEVGTTTFRPFYTPVSFGALTGSSTGHHFQPVRRSPLHGWAEKHNAVFVETGLWVRSSWFPRQGETHWRQSVDREVKTVREAAGLCDVSTLGKIEIFGADAAEFLNRVYCNAFAKLPVGKARYGLMLREDGMIYDDGTTSRLDENHFFMTTTTALAAGVMNHLEFCAQTLWPDLDVRMASSTDQWAQMAIAGPLSRAILQVIVDEDLSDENVPFLAAKTVSLFGGQLEGRLYRISFSGELAYELGVPAGFGEAVADALMEAGEPHGICAYGAEALGVLRIEKGHVTHAEINGTVTAEDLGFGRMVSQKKVDFIGKHMLEREGLVDAERPRLVGVKPLNPEQSFRTGAHILAKGAEATLENDQGYVTSSAFSPHVGSTIGLALVTRGPDRHGEEVVIWNALAGETVPGVLCDPNFVDPSNEKLHA